MKKWLIFIVIILTVALIVALKQASYSNQKWEEAMANIKNYDKELSTEKNKSTAYLLTLQQLSFCHDSVIQELKATQEELKIKDKNLKALQAITSTFIKKDTVVFHDTLFRDPALTMDTVLHDEWYSVNLGLRYPSTIEVSPCFVSKKHVGGGI